MAASLSPDQVAVVERLELVLGYVFSDKTLAWEAMQRDHHGKGFLRGRTLHQNNRRLALLGDFVIYLVMWQEWYASNDALKSWTEIRNRQTSNKFFCNIANGLKLDSQFLFPSFKNTGDPVKRMMSLATLVEAIVAAVWLDSGRDVFVTAAVLVVLGIMREDQMLSHELGATENAGRVAEKHEEEVEGPKLEEIVAREVASVTKQLSQTIEDDFQRQLKSFEQRMNWVETESAQEPGGEKSGMSNTATNTLKALPGRGLAKALSLGHRIWEAKLVLQTAIRAD